MNYSNFFKRFGIFSACIALLIPIQSVIPPLAEFQTMAWMTWLLFVLLTVGLFFLGKMALSSPNRSAFDGLLLSLNFIKIASSLIFILAYLKFFEPATNWFLIPFFLIYALYTIFEIDMLTKMGREQ